MPEPQKRPRQITDFFSANKRKLETKEGIVEIIEVKSLAVTIEEAHEAEEGDSLKHNDVNGFDEAQFCKDAGFNKEKWLGGLSAEERQLLALEINTMHITWLAHLHKELTKPYFLKLKRFLRAQSEAKKVVFPPPGHIYAWLHLTPLHKVKCLILGQDPYHNHNQAHGLAFSVLEPTRPPPLLLNIYKALAKDFENFQAPSYAELAKQGKPGGGNLTKWAQRGVLMLNACLTVEAHKANSHAGQGWELFTEAAIQAALKYARAHVPFVIMAWGTPAQKRLARFDLGDFCVLKTVHPLPLSASRGFFDAHVFKRCNEWLVSQNLEAIDWGLIDGNIVQ